MAISSTNDGAQINELKLRRNRPYRNERVYLQLCKVADIPFHIHVDEMLCVIIIVMNGIVSHP